MSRFSSYRCVLAAALFSAEASAQSYVDLNFSNNVQPALEMYPNNSTLGPYYTSIPTLDFTNAGSYNGTSIDVRVSMIGLTDGESSDIRDSSTYQWVGWLPDYNATGASDDLGVYYRHDGNYAQTTGGIAWTMSFYEGGSNFSTPMTLPGVHFLIYDHDGEPFQSEAVRAFESDGLAGYRLSNTSGIGVQDEDGSWRFDAAGANQSETGPGGGMILYYQNVDSIRFDLFSTTLPGLPGQNSGVFGAWDGNLGVNGGGVNGFGDFVPVPEPSTAALTVAAMAGFVLRRRRCP